jgi:amidophosphoribosyltransferase
MVIYQSLDALKKAVHMGNKELNAFCGACFDGCYPTGDVTPELLDSIEKERREQQQKQKRLNI